MIRVAQQAVHVPLLVPPLRLLRGRVGTVAPDAMFRLRRRHPHRRYFVKRRASATPAAVTKRARNIRRTICFSGSVQGVGFRYTTCDIASKFRVKGFIRNLPDGRVELVAEGREIDLDRFQCAVEEAMCGHISDVAATDSAATREFKKFVIAS